MALKRAILRGVAPLCGDDCGKHVKWNEAKGRWNKFLFGHSKQTAESNRKRSAAMKLRWAEAKKSK